MITIKLPGDIEATVTGGVWSVPANDEMERVLNSLAMQPPENGYYAPSLNARKAVYVLKVLGGEWVSSTEQAEPGKLY